MIHVIYAALLFYVVGNVAWLLPILRLRSQVGYEELELKILDAKGPLDIALNEQATTRDELTLKVVMKKNGMAMLDTSRFLRTVVGARQLGFVPRVIIEKVDFLD